MLKALLVVALIAVAIYYGVRLLSRRGLDGGGSNAKRRPLAPDDDPDFLRDLDRKRREGREE